MLVYVFAVGSQLVDEAKLRAEDAKDAEGKQFKVLGLTFYVLSSTFTAAIAALVESAT